MKLVTIRNFKTAARERGQPPEDAKEVTFSGWIAALLLALVGLVPTVGNMAADAWLKPWADRATIAANRETMEMNRQKAAIELYRYVLADPDSTQRHKMIRFLVAAKLVGPNPALEALSADQIPQWPAAAGTSP